MPLPELKSISVVASEVVVVTVGAFTVKINVEVLITDPPMAVIVIV